MAGKIRLGLRPLVGPALVSVLFFGWCVVRIGKHDGFHFYTSIRVGQTFQRPDLLLPGQRPVPGAGYDGQFYFYVAQDPFLQKAETALSLDNSLRYRRILYPLFAWLLAFGQRAWLPLSLIALNLLACTGTAILCAEAARRRGSNTWWSLVMTLQPGLWISLGLDLTEPLQCFFLALGFVVPSAGWLWLAGMAKETAFVALVTQACIRLRQRAFAPAIPYAVAMILVAMWTVATHSLVHAQESTYGGHFLDPPFAPLLALWRSLPLQSRLAVGLTRLLCLVSTIFCLAVLVIRLRSHRDPAACAAAAYALVVLGAGWDTWSDPVAYERVAVGALVLGFISWTSARDRWLGWGLLANTGVSVLIALVNRERDIPRWPRVFG